MQAADKQVGPMYEKYLREPLVALAQNREALKTGERLFITHCTGCPRLGCAWRSGCPNLRDSDWLWGCEPEARS